MGFRTLEIINAAEIHIKEGQMEIITEEGVAVIPIADYGAWCECTVIKSRKKRISACVT